MFVHISANVFLKMIQLFNVFVNILGGFSASFENLVLSLFPHLIEIVCQGFIFYLEVC